MVAAETHLNVREACSARLLPNWDAEPVSDVPGGTDLRVLRDEERDFIKVAYEGRPVYVPRTAVAAAPSVVRERVLLQSFAFRRDQDPRLQIAVGVASLTPVAPAILLSWGPRAFSSDWTYVLFSVGIVVVFMLGAWLAFRNRRDSIDVCVNALVLRSVRTREIPLAILETIGERHLGMLDAFRFSLPWFRYTLTLPPYPSRGMLEMTLRAPYSLGWFVSTDRILFDVEDRARFLHTVRESAPDVKIDPALLTGLGAR